MSVGQDDYYGENNEAQQQNSEDGGSLRRKMEKAIADAKAATAKASSLERELAFLKAGVDPEKPGSKYFIKGYDGEIEVEKIREAAQEAGFLVEAKAPEAPAAGGETPTDQPPEQTPEQQADLAAFQALGTATQTINTAGVNPLIGMEKAMQEGGVGAMTEWMRAHGMPVIEGQ